VSETLLAFASSGTAVPSSVTEGNRGLFVIRAVAGELDLEPLILAAHRLVRVDVDHARYAVDDQLVAGFDLERSSSDAGHAGTRAERARIDGARIAATIRHESSHPTQLEARGRRRQQLLGYKDGPSGISMTLSPSSLASAARMRRPMSRCPPRARAGRGRTPARPCGRTSRSPRPRRPRCWFGSAGLRSRPARIGDDPARPAPEREDVAFARADALGHVLPEREQLLSAAPIATLKRSISASTSEASTLRRGTTI